MLDALVVGAGISGLTLAYYLQQKNPQQQLLVAETNATVGGNMSSCSAEGFMWEEGPNSFTPTPEILQLAVDVGLCDDLLLADGKLPRYVFWQGRLFPVPMTPVAAATTSLLSPWGKVRGLLGALGFVPPVARDSSDVAEETVAQFFRRHLGLEITERLVAPFVSGVYAGAVDELSAAAAFARIYRLVEVGGGLVPGAIRTAKSRRAAKKTMPTGLPAIESGQLCSLAALLV
ncbi:MAG: protoporphyrinogen oxidase, partial [Cyanobacteria bacterium J06641_5]